MRKYLVRNINWDTDGVAPSHLGLPRGDTVRVDSNDSSFNPEDDLANVLSDRHGFCVLSCEFEELG